MGLLPKIRAWWKKYLAEMERDKNQADAEDTIAAAVGPLKEWIGRYASYSTVTLRLILGKSRSLSNDQFEAIVIVLMSRKESIRPLFRRLKPNLLSRVMSEKPLE